MWPHQAACAIIVGMNEETAAQLVKQLKRLNFWVTTFGVMFLLTLGVVVFLLVQVFMFAKSTGDKLDNFKQSTVEKLDVGQWFR